MTFKHGIYGREEPTKVIPPIIANVGMPVVIGTAPTHMARRPAEANKPVLVFSYEEAVAQFGYSDDWEKYTLSEFIYSQFALYGRAPVVLINVLDIETNQTEEKTESLKLVNGMGALKSKEAIPSTITITTGSTNLKLEEDYLISYGSKGELIITGASEKATGDLTVKFKEVDTSKITKEDIIGGIDVTTGKKKGLELVSEVYPRFRILPGTILTPGYSSDSEVAALLASKSRHINGLFGATALIDAPTNLNYTEVPEWKNKNGITESSQIVGWPKLKLGERIYHYSSQLAGVIQTTDEKYGNIPHKSPSNETIKIDSCVNDNGEVYLGQQEANYLNGQGIMTAINFVGWKTWGNRTAIYPTSSDIKDTMIPIRRMFDWTLNTLILTYWSKIDDPVNKRLVESVVDSANLWLNGLTAQGALYGGRIEFLAEDNPLTSLMDGKISFRFSLAPPPPAENITFIQEYDVGYLQEFVRRMSV